MSIVKDCLEDLITEGYTIDQIENSVNIMSDKYLGTNLEKYSRVSKEDDIEKRKRLALLFIDLRNANA